MIEHLGPGVSLVPEQWRFGSSGSRLFGREAETAMLDQLVARIPERGAALVLRGDPGIGKTALLAVASAAASSKGISVLRTAGAQTEIGLAFAGLHQLLRPVLTRLDRLPGPQRDALSAAFGAIDVPAPDPFMIALAALNLLADAAEQVPLLLVVDEAQWLDPPTAGALAFIARRVDAEPVAMLFALRDGAGSVSTTRDYRSYASVAWMTRPPAIWWMRRRPTSRRACDGESCRSRPATRSHCWSSRPPFGSTMPGSTGFRRARCR